MKREQDARKARAMREAAQRSLEHKRCSEMEMEDEHSRLAAIWLQNEEKREMEARRKAEDDKLLVLLAAARRSAKSAGACLSTPGLKGLERLAELTARVVAVEEETQKKRADIAAKLRLRYSIKRARAVIGNHVEQHTSDLMHTAILEQKWDTMLHLVAVGGISPDFEATHSGFTPLIMAMAWRKPSVARRLLDAGASIDFESAHGRTALTAAILADDIDSVRLCIARGADLSRESRTTGVTPLLLAVDKGRSHHVRVLLEAHVDPNAANSYGITPLIQATLSQQTGVAKVLFHHGASLSTRGKDDRTCIEWARRCMFHDFADTLESLNFEVGLAKDSTDGDDPLHNHDATVDDQDVAVVIRLVERGVVGPNAESAAGWTPLLVACARGTLAQVQTLLALGSIAVHPNRRGRTPLVAACERGAADMITCLVNAGASFAVVDCHGKDAFHALVEYPELVQLWTAVRSQFRPTVALGVPTRAGIALAVVAHAVPMHQTTIPDTTSIDVPPATTLTSPEDNGDDDERRNWQTQRTQLRRNRAKLMPFYEEREKIFRAQQRGRRHAVSVPTRDPNAGPPPKARLCENCLGVRATVVCVKCIMAFCDRCLMERHYGPAYHHHETMPLDKDVGVHLRPVVDDHTAMHVAANVERCKLALAGIAKTFPQTVQRQPSNQCSLLLEDEDGDIRARKQADKRAADAKRRDAIMNMDVPRVAATRCEARGASVSMEVDATVLLAR
ncbi:hypothetical protein DYB32_009977 [Aphanomyces invadans]|uniref:B box-type domain-containing protein n=1 Tax=Aphanomyces invadans TaxID=157072 RepID=A0A418AH53_9STRA|nr:hypothetical protein DYB32_009977 [Aphanomyces invadans]